MSIQSPGMVLHAFGLRMDRGPVADNKIHRAPHSAAPDQMMLGGTFSMPSQWRAWFMGVAMSPTAALARERRKDHGRPTREMRRLALLRHEQIETERQDVASRIREFLSNLQQAAPNHPYLVRKSIRPHQALQSQECLVLPLQDGEGVIWSAQSIAPFKREEWGNRDKSFERGGRVGGCFHLIGRLDRQSTVVVCEGFATGATIAETTGLPVACALNCGNLESVVAALTERVRSATLVLAADNDAHTEGNPGLTKAREAARKYNCLLAVPDFGDIAASNDCTDFNDLRRLRGADAVRVAILEAGTPDRATRDTLGRFTVALPDSISVEMPRFLDELARALMDANERRDAPRYLCRGDAIALVVGQGRASRLLVATEHLVRAELQRDVLFVRRMREGDGGIKDVLAGVLPQGLARDIAKTPIVAFRLPGVDGVAGCPIMDRCGTVTTSGYSKSLRLVCACDPWELDPPSLGAARDRLLGLLSDYQFVTAADQARALASLLQPALVMGGHVERGPAMLVVADQPSTGKGTLVAQRCAIYGATARAITMRERGGVGSLDEDLSVQIVDGALFVNIDNARGAIRSQVFESALTEPCVTLRVPLRTPVSVDPRKINFSITSNGVTLTPDLALRCSIVRLRKQSPGYRFTTARPVATAVAERCQLLGAIFAILGDWVRQGSPRAETDYDGHARDFWSVVDEIIPRVFGLPRPTQDLKAAALAGTDPLLELFRTVGIALKARGQLPSPPINAVQLLRVASEEGAQYDGRNIPIDSEKRLIAMASAVGRRASRHFEAGSLRVDEFQIEQFKEFIRRDPTNSHAGTYEGKLYRIDLIKEVPDGSSAAMQHQQQYTVEPSRNTPSVMEVLHSTAAPAAPLERGTNGKRTAIASSLIAGNPTPIPLPAWWDAFLEAWHASGQDRSRQAVSPLLLGFGCFLGDAVAHGWLEVVAQRVTLGPALNGVHRPACDV